MYTGLHTNYFFYLPFGQVNYQILEFYLPERQIYLPEKNAIKKLLKIIVSH